ncbi:DUF5677 domain-containing protein [Dactylosporangium sp. NPDC050688]|uniref:DUF5677 domain-containing protein n=1 Tax=Dactylosporangium sp. NPDC050688 TaxID=3157217 RepID=UPI00340C18F8
MSEGRLAMGHSDFSETVYRKAEEVAQQLIDQGVPREKAVADVAGAIIGEADNGAGRVLASLLAKQDTLLEQERAIRREFESRLEADWGTAFDAFFVAAYCVAEAGDRYLFENEEDAVRRGDEVFEVLAGLHARARRISFEIHRLLTGGFPLGAFARARTLHEIAITAYVIGEYGRAPATNDLARRYLDQEVIHAFRYLKELVEDAGPTVDPALSTEFAAVQVARQALIAKYGDTFAKDNGWAAPLTASGKAPTFHELHRFADMTHLRTDYRLMCGEVHAGAAGLSLNLVEFDGGLVSLPGPTNVGFSDPGTLALASLGQITWAFFLGGRSEPADLTDLLSLKTLNLLIERFGPLAEAAEQKVMEREAQLDRHPE